MRYFLTRRAVPLTRILLVESGSRSLIEGLLPHLREGWSSGIPVDLVTCRRGVPTGLAPDAVVYRVADYGTPEGRKELLRQLRARNYSILGILCSDEPVMTKWKWWIALRLPVKVFMINENGDYFWIHREQLGTLRDFCLLRLGLAGEGSARTIFRLLLFPFSVLFLLLYAFAAHSRRLIWRALHTDHL